MLKDVKFTGPTMVLLVRDLDKSVEFYNRLGFKYELIGGPDVQHVLRGPDLNDFFSEFTIRDVDGYRIAFGG